MKPATKTREPINNGHPNRAKQIVLLFVLKVSEMQVLQIKLLNLYPMIYPRERVDADHVFQIKQAMSLGVTLPPVVVCSRTRNVIDGFHRITAAMELYGEEHGIECIEKDYEDEKAMFLDAIKFNATHGKALTTTDKEVCVERASELSIDSSAIASAIYVDSDELQKLSVVRSIRRQEVTATPARPYRPSWKAANAARKPQTEVAEPITPTISPRVADVVQVDSKPKDLVHLMNARHWSRSLLELFENGQIDTDDDGLRSTIEELNWHIEEVYGFTAK